MNYRLVFNGPIKATPGNALRARVSSILEQGDFESLTVIFSSEGGDTREGLSLYNFFRSLPEPVTMHAAGHVDSMAVPVFLAGATRTSSPTARFYFHPFAWTFDSSQRLDGLDDVSERFLNDVESARSIVVERANLPAAMTESLYGRGSRPTVADPHKAVEWGIVDEITELNAKGESQSNTAVWTVTW
ncbi:MAG TPA: ATP-dependent Clp protease proteolytic subunit [Actinomycetota bacterium]|nr:ATP-dependent Clp protease proteolytic subunit [Actinomycetota bacterium]